MNRGIYMSIFDKLFEVGKQLGSKALDALKDFNPFSNDEYKNASYEEQRTMERNVSDIANDKTLDHEYRMEAQRVLVQIESYRHAEELARIDGTTKITIVQIEATKEIVIAKIDVIKESIIRASNKEIALINAMGSSPELADKFLERLDNTTHDINCLSDKADLYGSEVLNLGNLMQNAKVEAIEYKKNQAWADTLWEWADNNDISDDDLPRVLDELTQLTHLDLSNNHLTELPKEIGKLTQLTELNLSINSLTDLPKEIGKLIQLTELNLSINSLTDLPKEIGNLTKLTSLYLSPCYPVFFDDGNNRLTEIPKEIGNLIKLTELDLSRNKLTEIPKEIGNLTRLKKLKLNDNKLTELPKEIGNLTQLTTLDLSSNELRELPCEIDNLIKITELNFEHQRSYVIHVA
ncbi:MAG: hypothetical protein ACI9LM_004028 [Alteromonadaceae bacterium]|jgi:hypothetical protein